MCCVLLCCVFCCVLRGASCVVFVDGLLVGLLFVFVFVVRCVLFVVCC